ncbi:restriction endonuclease subunit S [Shewanella algae]|uniref:restriction endonuclease subunit S n=1 Tax=Shewanella algae TaxID=38313 RepID=UPI0031F4EE33
MTNLSGINLNNGTAVGAKREGMDSPSQSLALMPKYDDYVDSGVEWLGRVPASWELTRLGTRFNERRSKVSDIDYPALSVTKKGVLPQLDNAAKTKDGDNRKLVKEGDFVINSRSDRKGSSGVSDRDGSVSLINIVLKPKGIHPKFSEHLLKSHAFIEEYYRVGRGIVADLWTTRYDEMRTITISVPSLEEQTLIANFLDKKTAQIDDAIAIKEQQINLLKERKQIIIQQAVTQGLDPNVPMKDSGVDWIGEIPEHWEVARVKHATKVISKGTTPSTIGREILEQGEIRFIKAENLVEGNITNIPLCFIDKKTNDLLLRSSLQVGDVLFVIAGATLGKTAVVSEEVYPANTNQAVAFLRPNKLIEPTYLPLWLSSNIINQLIWLDAVQSAQPNLSMEDLGNFPLIVPPRVEQLEIMRAVAAKIKDVDEAISLQMSQINALKEYKTTLINSAVTGKIKITPEMVEQ